MKKNIPLLLLIAIFIQSCAVHHPINRHHGNGSHGSHGGHVAVNTAILVHGGHHGGRGGNLLGALIIGGIIGHIITEVAHEEQIEETTNTTTNTGEDIQPSEKSNE